MELLKWDVIDAGYLCEDASETRAEKFADTKWPNKRKRGT